MTFLLTSQAGVLCYTHLTANARPAANTVLSFLFFLKHHKDKHHTYIDPQHADAILVALGYALQCFVPC